MGQKRKQRRKNKNVKVRRSSFDDDCQPILSQHQQYGSTDDVINAESTNETPVLHYSDTANPQRSTVDPPACDECLKHRDGDLDQGPCVHTAYLASNNAANTWSHGTYRHRLRKVGLLSHCIRKDSIRLGSLVDLLIMTSC